jgi:glutamate-1-semialdehyde aminotransferase
VLSAVCGRADIMEHAQESWISSTLAGEASALAAATAVLDWYASEPVCEHLWSIGKDMRQAVTSALHASGLKGVTVEGIDPMWFFRWDSAERETRFLESAARHGALFKRGPYNFASLAHNDDALTEIETAASNAFVELRDAE